MNYHGIAFPKLYYLLMMFVHAGTAGLEVGFAYAFGILLAIVVCSATSGGHFNPCVSIAFTIYKGFPPLKAMR
jgi:glycerol uptake facilitator-like aquaporin